MQKCRECSSEFTISDKDREFYRKVSPEVGEVLLEVPPPTLCPDCRQKRRLTWRNVINLYHRKCDKTGKNILSIYRPESPYTVYEHHEWYSDSWNALDFGRDFDFSRPFFDQFDELMKVVPRFNLDVKSDNENCDYTHLMAGNRNCYMSFAGSENEDSYYSTYFQRNKNVCDCYFTFESELCYECVDCYSCYKLKYSQYCENCSDSSFLFNCQSCKDCFGSVSLINKQYYFFNEEKSQEEYQRLVSEFFNRNNYLEEAKRKVEDLKSKFPVKYYAGINNENITGDHISYCKNTFDCYDVTYLEDCRYCVWMHQSKDCYDCYGYGLPGELGYEVHLGGNGFHSLLFSESCWDNVANLIYCNFCVSGSKDLFGCIGLKGQQYCVLNKQYSQEEYENLVPRIVEHMKISPLARGDVRSETKDRGVEWGEFFPARLSPFAYNETDAQLFFPLTKEAVIYKGWKWFESKEKLNQPATSYQIPATIKEVTDDILSQTLSCDVEGCNYKIIKQELDLYRRLDVPIPKKCFKHRYFERLKIRNPRKLWNRSCDKCDQEIQTSYVPGSPENVYCQKCYLSEVY